MQSMSNGETLKGILENNLILKKEDKIKSEVAVVRLTDQPNSEWKERCWFHDPTEICVTYIGTGFI